MKFTKLIVSSSLVFLAGCNLSSTYLRPELPAGPSWPAVAVENAVASTDRWWQAFRDPNLDTLVVEVIGRNNELLIAAVAAYGAQLQTDIAAQALKPNLNGNLGEKKTFTGEASSLLASSAFSVSYEIDLWGKLAAKRDKADIAAYATAEDWEAARLLAIGQTVETYLKIAHANQSLASANASLAHVKQIRALVRGQVAAGVASDLELMQAEQKVEDLAATVSARKQDRLVLRNALIVLLNGAANPVPEPQRLPGKKLPPIQAGVPADLLARRPDLRAAEARLRARLKGVDVTRASLYPTISLTSELGTSSPQLLGFISNPVGTLGANVALSFLNLKNSNLMVAPSRQEYEKEVLDFRTTLLGAFSEVADALGARADDAERVRRHRNVLAATQAIEHLQETSYRAGGINFKTWLDAQENRRAAEIALANVRLAQVLNESKLYRIIGGAVGKGAKSLIRESEKR